MSNQELKIVYDSEGRAIVDKEVLDLLLKEHEELVDKRTEVSNLKEDLAAMTAYAEMFERGEIGNPDVTNTTLAMDKLAQLYTKLELYEKEPKKSYIEQILELQDEVKVLRRRLHWIWAIGVDYDGCGTVESLKELIDELVDFTQMTDEQVDYSIYRKGAIETANKITHYLYRMSQTDTSKEVAIGRCIDWIKNNFEA